MLPGSIILVTCLSLFAAVCILACSVLDRGLVSVWVNPACAILTICYHTSLLGHAWARPNRAAIVMFSTTAIAGASILAILWMGAFAVMVFIARGDQTKLYLNGTTFLFPSHFDLSQKLQFMSAPVEFTLLGDLAVRATIFRRYVVDNETR